MHTRHFSRVIFPRFYENATFARFIVGYLRIEFSKSKQRRHSRHTRERGNQSLRLRFIRCEVKRTSIYAHVFPGNPFFIRHKRPLFSHWNFTRAAVTRGNTRALLSYYRVCVTRFEIDSQLSFVNLLSIHDLRNHLSISKVFLFFFSFFIVSGRE